MDSAMFQLMRSAEQAACDLKRLLDMEARSSEENRQGHQMNMELLEKILALLHSEPAEAGASPGHNEPGMLSEQRLEQELADLRAAVVCAKDSKQAQEEHYLRQIIKHIEEMEAGDLLAINHQAGPDPPANLVCPITRCLFEDPVIVVETGHTYERRAIEEHFLVNGSTNPLTNHRLKSETLAPNLNVRWQADDWRKEHPTYTQAAAAFTAPTALNMLSGSNSTPYSVSTLAAGSSRPAAPAGRTINQLSGSESAPAAAAAFTLSPAATALLEAVHAQGLDTGTSPAAHHTAVGAPSSRRTSSSTGHRAGSQSHAAAYEGAKAPHSAEVRVQIPQNAAAAAPGAAASGQPSPGHSRPASAGRNAVARSYGQLLQAQYAAPGQRYPAECGWEADEKGKKQVPGHRMSSSSGKGKVPDIRSRLRKAFNGVFVTSKHQTAVNMRAIGLLVDVIFRVVPFTVILVLLYTTPLWCQDRTVCIEATSRECQRFAQVAGSAGCWTGMLFAVCFMACGLVAHMLAPESLGCEACSTNLCYNHRLKTKWLVALDVLGTVFALVGGIAVAITSATVWKVEVPESLELAVKSAADAVVALFFLVAVSSRLIRVLVLAPWCA
jgi:hypothetical protein